MYFSFAKGKESFEVESDTAVAQSALPITDDVKDVGVPVPMVAQKGTALLQGTEGTNEGGHLGLNQ